ncbi:MAG: ATP-binding protein, partial [Clostridia bacterium]
SSRAFSAAETEWIDTHDSLKVGYLNNYLPYSDTDEKGNATGVVKDLLPHMLQQMGLADIRVSYQGYDSYDDMVRAVNKGTIDTAFPVGGGLYFSEENGIYQTSPVISAPMEFVYRGEYSKEKTRSFAVNENNRMQHYYVITEYPDAQIHLYPSIDDCLDAVKSGEVGGTVLNGMRANDILRNDEYRELSMRQMSRSDDRCFGVKIGNDGLLRILNRGISIIGADYATNISYRYTEALYDVTLMDMIRKNMVAVGAFLLAIAALIIFLLVRESRRQKRARIETDNANRAKTAFLNNMSHDIRTPMNAIVGFTSLAKTHLDDKEQVEEYLDKISVSSQHLLSLINDVLDMSRIESGKVTIEETEVHLPDLLRDLRTIVQPAAASKNQSFIVDTEGVKTKDIITDKLRLNQILLNLLTNAIKFTPEGGMVCFQVTEKPSDTDGAVDFTFRIEDNGVGMSEEFQRTIFEAFTREKSSTASGIQGTGLGMAITKNIVDMMGGTITIRSEEDKGTEVTVDLTCRIDDGRTRPDPAPQTEADFTGRRILLAEDNELNQMIAVRMLEDFGFTIEVAGDGQEAVDKMREASAGHYDIVLMDIQMPNMDGYEAARQIRALEDPKKAGIPIIAVTANAFEEDRRTALDAGMNGHLAKPYDVPKMIEVLSEELRQGESAEGKGAGDAR